MVDSSRSTPASPGAISESAHISAITQLVLAERECRDMGRWERMKSCYRAELRDGAWKLCSFEAFYMRDELAPRVPGETIPVTSADLAGFRPSYCNLSYVLACSGYSVRDDLPGEDRPESVEELCLGIYGWAGLEL